MTAPSRLLSLIVCGVLLAGCGKSRTDAPTAARPDAHQRRATRTRAPLRRFFHLRRLPLLRRHVAGHRLRR